MTLHQLRSMLALSHGPAVERLPDRTPEGVALTYLTRHLSLKGPAGATIPPRPIDEQMRWDIERQTVWHRESLTLDLTDPGTVNGIRTALALARGADPAEGVIWKRWSSEEWALETSSLRQHFRIHEPDPIRALVLAVEHVLGAS